MTDLYFLRLACLSMAAFVVVHTTAALLVSALAPFAMRLVERVKPVHAAAVLMALRLLPLGIAVFAVAALCVPSYLVLEPVAEGESIGGWCLAAAALCTAIWFGSIRRVLRTMVKSSRLARYFREVGHDVQVAGEIQPVCVIDHAPPCLALAGVVRPRIVISDGVLAALSAGQLVAALRHEQAHRAAGDNLKRLLILLAPDMLPGFRGLKTIERRWAKFTEWAADDRAVAGDRHRSLSLAAALVRVARLGGGPRLSPLAASLLGDTEDFTARVERLLRTPAAVEPQSRRTHALMAAAALTSVCALLALVLHPATLPAVHRMLEFLVD